MGISTEFVDWRGETRHTRAQTLRAVLAALDIDASDPERVARANARIDEAPWRRTLPPVVVERVDRERHLPVHVPHGERVTVRVELEDGSARDLEQLQIWIDPRHIDDALVGRATFLVPAGLPLGWHRLVAEVGEGQTASTHESVLVVTPASLGSVTARDETPKTGVMAQVYQLRSQRSWGVGDLRDLKTLSTWAAGQGADFVLVNPFHASAPVSPVEPSPYLPTTRQFRDPSLIDISRIPGIRELSAEHAEDVLVLAWQARQQLQDDRIDRDASFAARDQALRIIHPVDLKIRDRRREFGAFCEAQGSALVRFATYCAIATVHGADWTAWPAELHDPESSAVRAFRDEHGEDVDYFRWLQWVLDEQLAAVQERAKEAGMSIGIMHDLAVGVHPTGADSWAMPSALARGVTVGAPPDMFNQRGQNWSQPPLRPDRMEELAYAPFRDMVRAALRHGGALRIDHILGLFRLWWIPKGASAADGAYVSYDEDALLGILALEAECAGALIVGEDMGVVPPHTRAKLLEYDLDGTSVLWFELDEHGAPIPPEQFRVRCLASVTTHDLPPTTGYLALDHVTLRDRLGLLTDPVEQEREREREVIARMRDALIQRGFASSDAGERELVLALHRYLAASSARLFGVSVADLAEDRRPVNQPGTHEEYPNWQVPLTGANGQIMLLEDVLASAAAEELMAAARRHEVPAAAEAEPRMQA